MSAHETDHRRTELEAERDRLRSELSDLGVGTPEAVDYDANFADTSQVTAERGEAEALAGELTETLVEVEATLGRLDTGSYGTCERCGAAISSDRLDAMPMARLCISCAGAA
jgi:RNA polymerase-binding transcription factor DksA